MGLVDIHAIFEKHKHLWIVLLAALAILLITWKVLGYMEGKDSKDLIIKQAQLDVDKKAEKAADAQRAQDQKAYDQLKAQLDAQNNAFRSQIADLQKQLSAQQAKDATLVPAELAARHRELIKASDMREIQPTSNGYQISQLAELTTVQQLEVVPALQSQNADLTGILENKDKQISEMEKVGKDLYAQIDACKVTQKSQDVVCKAEVKDLKAKARKSKLKWFLGGLATGGAFVAKLLI